MYGYELYEDLGVNDEWPNSEERYLFDPENIDPYKLFPILEDRKAVEVPKLQNFETYIQIHFKDQLVDEFCRYIATDDVYSDMAIRLDTESVRFIEMHFYAESRTEVCADIKMEILVNVTDDGETYIDDITRTFRVLFIMEPRKRIRGKVLEIFQNWPKQRRKKLWNLSSYLIPRLTKDDLENHTREILKKYLPEGLNDQHQNDAYKLAENMGLTVVPLPLHGYAKTRTILFFRKGTISIEVEDPITEKKTRKVVSVDRNTIVVNTNVVHSFCDRYSIDVYHECIHFEWHYLFYRLQDMHNNDLKQIRKEYRIRYNKENVQDSLSWLEWQAKRGSMCIWMPKPFMDSEMLTLSRNGRWDIRAEKYEYIGTEISDEYKIPKYRVRARMINLGMIEAKGAFNYYVDHYVRPFAFSTQQYLGNHTFFIEPKEFARLFREDLRFRELMTTCNLVYVDGFVCLNDPSYIRMGYDGTPHLTDEARFAVDKCCLRFEEIYELDSEIGYCFGRLNSDLPFNEHYFQYPGCGVIAHLTYCDKMKNLKEYVESLPRTFSAMLTKFMGDMGMTSDQLMRATGFSESTVQRLRNKGSINYKVDKVVALICLFHLPPPVSLVFLQSAGISIFDNTEDCVYQMIVSNMYYYSIEALQKTLTAWRDSNPNITKLWWAVDKAAMTAVKNKTFTETHGLRFCCKSGFLFITLPSGRQLAYVKPRIGENQFGSPAITYEGVGSTKKWERLESYGPKFVENIVQATSRDILCYAMSTLRNCDIVAHVHDELIIEADPRVSLEAICEQMGRTPPWCPGLILRADGYTTPFYKKD